MMYDFKLGNWQELFQDLAPGYASWNPDGKDVYFNSTTFDQTDKDSPEYGVPWRSKIERVADMARAGKLVFGSAVFGEDLRRMVLSFTLRDVGVEEIYALDVQLP